MTNQFIISKFMKRKAIIAHIKTQDERIVKRWAIPQGGTISIKGFGKFELNNDAMYLSDKNVPTYFYNFENTEPIIFETGQVTNYDPKKYDTAMNTKVMTEWLKSTQGNTISSDTFIIVGAVLISALGVAYYLSTEIAKIYEVLSQLGFVTNG